MSEMPEPADRPRQPGWLPRAFSNPWVSFLTAACSVIAVPLAIYLYLAGTKTRRLTYSVNPVKTVVVKGGEASTLRVLHGDQELKGDVTAAQVAIWNDGKESIRPENVLSLVCVALRPSVPILEAKIRKVSRGVIGAALDGSRLADGVVPVTWKILEHNDGAVVQLIFAGSTQTGTEVEGIVEGQPMVFRVEPPAGGRRHSPWFNVGGAVSLFFMTGMFFWLNRLRRRRADQLDLLDRYLPWVMALGLCMWLVASWLELNPAGPPFGF